MNFTRYETIYNESKRDPDIPKVPRETICMVSAVCPELSIAIRGVVETFWYEYGCPFYKVWPRIYEAFTKTRLDLTLHSMQLVRKSFALYLPESIGYSVCVISDPKPIIALSVQRVSDLSTACAKLSGELPIERLIEEHAEFTPLLKLAIGVLLLSNDPEYVEAEVLAKDRAKYDRATPEERKRLIEKAKRRGINGFRLGERVEVAPHFRKAHFAVRWTGPGRTIPKLTAIKGSVIHKNIVTQVPTGYESQESRR